MTLLNNKQLSRFFFSKVNQFYIPNKPNRPTFTPVSNQPKVANKKYTSDPWSKDQVMEASKNSSVYTWGATDPMIKSAFQVKRAEGVYLIDYNEKKYVDWTSQAICTNLGYTVPQQVLDATMKQFQTLPYLYSGLTMCEARAKLSSIMSDISPASITGFVFPNTGSDANELAIRSARRFTGRNKILTRYRSYHGAASGTLTATGDFRRQYAENGVSGFVKFFDLQAFEFKWGLDESQAVSHYLTYLEETITNENPNTIAAIMIETITGSGGVLINPQECMEGIRALCDKYGILLIFDEVMAGLGRSGEMFAFQTYKDITPDIFTCAKGISGSFLPLAGVGFGKKLHDFYRTNALGWGTTFQGHPVSCTLGYECVRYMLENDICGHVRKMETVVIKRMDGLIAKHNSLRQARIKGLFGCMDMVGPDGQFIQKLYSDPVPEKVVAFKKKLLENGIFAWIRSPLFHCVPPLVITEKELNDSFDKIDDALTVLDH